MGKVQRQGEASRLKAADGTWGGRLHDRREIGNWIRTDVRERGI